MEKILRLFCEETLSPKAPICQETVSKISGSAFGCRDRSRLLLPIARAVRQLLRRWRNVGDRLQFLVGKKAIGSLKRRDRAIYEETQHPR
jgi:hypothetical protein